MSGKNNQKSIKLDDGFDSAPVILFRRDRVRVITQFRVIEVSTVDGSVYEFVRKSKPAGKVRHVAGFAKAA